MWVERNGKTWRVRDEVAGRKVDLATGYPNITAARAAMILLKAEALRGESLVPRGGKTTLNAHVDEWWPGYLRGVKPSTAESERARLDCHILPMLGHLTLDDVDGVLVGEWVSMLTEGNGAWRKGSKRRRTPLAPKSVANCHGLLFVIMKAAVAKRLIRTNPCVGTTLPERVHHEMRFLTDAEITRLMKVVPSYWRPLVLLLLATGMRWGEAIGLRAGRVDLTPARPRLLVVEQLQELAGSGRMVWTTPKSARGRRTVSFRRRTADALAPLVRGKDKADVVFRAPGGGLVRSRVFRRLWVKWTKEAGVEGLRIHDLRHTHASILISAGRPFSAISRRLGHASYAVTDAIYGHIREEADEGILDAIDVALDGVDLDFDDDADTAALVLRRRGERRGNGGRTGPTRVHSNVVSRRSAGVEAA